MIKLSKPNRSVVAPGAGDALLNILLEFYGALTDLDRRSLTDGDKGDVTVSGGGKTLTIDVAYSRARLEDAKAMASLHP